MIRVCAAAFILLLTGLPLRAQGPSQKQGQGLIRSGDILRLRIWREPDMSGDFAVNSTGQVILPRLGPMAVTAIPADSLQSILTERYRVYLNNPSIEVLLLRRVSITGAVRNPGVYPLDPTLTISDAIALAGGPAPDGKRDRVEIRRNGSRVAADLRNDTIVADSPVESGDQIYVPTRAWLSRNTWLISAALTVSAVALRQTIK